MSGRARLGVSDALYLRPLLAGLDRPESPFDLLSEIPAGIAHKFSERPEEIRGAFLSPIDYGRHGGEYLIVPRIAVASSLPTGTVQLFVKENARDIRSMAVDIRVTSEIILARIILLEKFPNLSGEKTAIEFIPMLPDLDAMLKKADSALVAWVAPSPSPSTTGFFLDLVEEWNDLTDLPYVHGVWVARDQHLTEAEASALLSARDHGVNSLGQLAGRWASEYGLSPQACLEYLSSFSYGLGEDEEKSLSEYFRYAYYHGVLGDVPDMNFMQLDLPPRPPVSPN